MEHLTKQYSDVNISTLTLIIKLGTKIDTKSILAYMLKEKMVVIKDDNVVLDKLLYNDCKKQFKNQLSLQYKYNNGVKVKNINVKVFNNGTLHFTGCNSTKKIEHILLEINKLYQMVDIPQFDVSEAYSKLDVQMMNCTLETSHKYHQQQFKDILLSKYNILASFDPKTYAGVNAKYTISGRKLSSFLIFASGKIIIAGSKNCEDLLQSRKFILDIIEAEKDAIIVPEC